MEIEEGKMHGTDEFFYDGPALKAYVEGEVAVIKIKCRVFDTITDLAESGKFISFFQVAERSPEIKALMIINQGGCFNEIEYRNFLDGLVADRNMRQYSDEKPVYERADRTRQVNILNRIITQIVEFKKISLVALQQHVVTPFFGAALGADFRYVSEDMVFVPAHMDLGLPPGGALPFFLPYYVGHARAVEILFRGGEITAKKAYEMGLVTEILPVKNFESRCIEEVRRLCRMDSRLIHATKLLLNFSKADLRRYFDTEAALIH